MLFYKIRDYHPQKFNGAKDLTLHTDEWKNNKGLETKKPAGYKPAGFLFCALQRNL